MLRLNSLYKELFEDTKQSSLDDLIQRIKSSLLENPGKSYLPNTKESSLPRAAVALILKPDAQTQQLYALLIKRKIREGDPWSGHMAFPGGRYSESDQNLLATVIREVMEETSLDLREFSMLGALDEIVPSSFFIRVSPYVAITRKEPNVKIDPKEVEDFVWIPLSFFFNPDNKRPYRITRLGRSLQVPCYKFSEDEIIWGLTLRIIEDLISKIR